MNINPDQVRHTYLFPSGRVVSYNWSYEQIPDLQGQYSRELHIAILKNSSILTTFAGFPLISMHEPTFSKSEAIDYLKLCWTESEVFELKDLLWSQCDRYDRSEYIRMLTEVEARIMRIVTRRMLSRSIAIPRSDRIFINPNTF